MKRITIILASALALLLFVSIAFAQGGYDLSWWTVDGGGDTFSQGGSYSLGGTAGQPHAGVLMDGGSYTLAGGFWGSGGLAEGPESSDIYLPIILKNTP
jgi:hypothetical protein